MSESESLWNAIDFLQRAFQDQPERFGSRSMGSLFGIGTALYDATKRLVPDSGNAVAATERGLEYAPLIASALVECVFFDTGVPGPIKHTNCGPLPVSTSVKTTSQGVGLNPSAVPPATQNLTRSLAVLVTMAAKAPSRSRALPPITEDPAATPTALMAEVVVMAGVIMTATPTMLTAAHDGG